MGLLFGWVDGLMILVVWLWLEEVVVLFSFVVVLIACLLAWVICLWYVVVTWLLWKGVLCCFDWLDLYLVCFEGWLLRFRWCVCFVVLLWCVTLLFLVCCGGYLHGLVGLSVTSVLFSGWLIDWFWLLF